MADEILVPEKISQIMESYKHDITIDKMNDEYIAVIGVNLPCNYYFEHNIVLNDLSAKGIADRLDFYQWNCFDYKQEAKEIYESNEGEKWGDKVVGKDILCEDIERYLKKEDNCFYKIIQDIYSKCVYPKDNHKETERN